MSHARSMQRKRCLCRQLGMAGTVSMGTRRARLHSTGTHGMDCACRCDRAARLVRPVRDVDSCTADELHVGLQCCCNRILVQRRRRETPVRCFSTPPLTKRLYSRRCGRVRCQTAPFHSKPRLEAALHPPFWYLNSDTIFRFRAPSRARSRVWLEPKTPYIGCGALLAGVIPDGRGPSHIGPKLRTNFLFALHTPVRSGV